MQAFNVQVKLKGQKALERKLNSLAQKVVKKTVRQGISVATKPLIPKIKAVMPVGPGRPKHGYRGGNLKKSIGRRFRSYRKSGISLVVVGPRWPKGAHAHWIEWGTVERSYKTGIFRRHRTGRIGPRNLMVKVWDENEHTTKAIAIREIRRRLLQEAKRG